MYSVYNTAGTYYFGSDLGNPVDTGNPFSNLLTGNMYGYGEDNKKQINHARYTQMEWFAQDTWKLNRRVTIDAGLRFQFLGALRSQGATLGIFDQASYKDASTGQLLYPYCTVPVGGATSCPTANKASINPATGRVYPYAQQGTFDPLSYAGKSCRSPASCRRNYAVQQSLRSGGSSRRVWHGMSSVTARRRCAPDSASSTVVHSASTP